MWHRPIPGQATWRPLWANVHAETAVTGSSRTSWPCPSSAPSSSLSGERRASCCLSGPQLRRSTFVETMHYLVILRHVHHFYLKVFEIHFFSLGALSQSWNPLLLESTHWPLAPSVRNNFDVLYITYMCCKIQTNVFLTLHYLACMLTFMCTSQAATDNHGVAHEFKPYAYFVLVQQQKWFYLVWYSQKVFKWWKDHLLAVSLT